MSYKPILFSTPMVQAIMDGRKTMTRRVVKNDDNRGIWAAVNNVRETSEYGANVPCYLHREISVDDKSPNIIYPKYDVGDILWVRETWGDYDGEASFYTYRADFPNGATTYEWPGKDEFGEKIICDLPRWRPSIFMPKEACRLFLRVADVRVERLQDITEEDAWSEGAGDPYDYQRPDYYEQPHMRGIEYKTSAFAGLWDSINAKRGYGWDKNPWVWVYSFERIEKPAGWLHSHGIDPEKWGCGE